MSRPKPIGGSEKKFRDAVKGIPTNHLTAALNTFTPGVQWQGCSKEYMSARYREACIGVPLAVCPALKDVDLEQLKRRAKARESGFEDWKTR